MTRAVFLDALGTLVELEPIAPRLAAALGTEADSRMETAVLAEMAYYREHAHEGTDERALAALRARAAAVLSEALGRAVAPATLMDAIRFRAFEDAPGALRGLRGRGMRLICVSNWDVGLPEVLAGCGLLDLLDGVVTSAGAGVRKPDPAIFAPALELADCRPEEAIHVGDSPREDATGARAAGIEAVLLDRSGAGGIASLAEIVNILRP